MKYNLILLITIFCLGNAQDHVSNVVAAQRTDGSRIVDIYYDLLPNTNYPSYQILVGFSGFGGTNGEDFINISLGLNGDIGDNIFPGNSKHITWDLKHMECDHTQISYNQNNLCNAVLANYGCDPETMLNLPWDDQYIENNQIQITAVGNQFSEGTPFEMETVPAGEFTQGPGDTLKTIDYDYMMTKYEITNGQYLQYLMESVVFSYQDLLDILDGETHATYVGDFTISHIMTAVQDYEYTCELTSVMGYYPGDQWTKPGLKPLYILDVSGGDESCYAMMFSVESGQIDNRVIRWNGDIFTLREPIDPYGPLNNHPVVGVTYFGAWHFANYYGMRLPNNDEWEKAARGDTGSNYSSSSYDCTFDGQYPDGAQFWNSIGNPGWIFENQSFGNYIPPSNWDPKLRTTTVGYFNGENVVVGYLGEYCETTTTGDSQSPYGIYDMIGNTGEYINDDIFYSLSRSGAPFGGSFLQPEDEPPVTFYDSYILNGLSIDVESWGCDESLLEQYLAIDNYFMPIYNIKSVTGPGSSSFLESWAIHSEHWVHNFYNVTDVGHAGIRCVITIP